MFIYLVILRSIFTFLFYTIVTSYNSFFFKQKERNIFHVDYRITYTSSFFDVIFDFIYKKVEKE